MNHAVADNLADLLADIRRALGIGTGSLPYAVPATFPLRTTIGGMMTYDTGISALKMQDGDAVYPMPRYFRTQEAALYVALSPRTMEKHRCYGTGPVYRKLGGRVVYALEDLEAWVELGRRRSTSDLGRGVVYPAKRQADRISKRTGS